MADDLEVTMMGERTTLQRVRGGRAAVVDFWTTGCHRCPAALRKLNDMAASLGDVCVLSICLDEANADIAVEMVKDLKCLGHAFASLEVKEQAKARWDFKFVPHIVVINADGGTALSKSAVGLAPESIRQALQEPDDKENQSQQPAFSLDEDF